MISDGIISTEYIKKIWVYTHNIIGRKKSLRQDQLVRFDLIPSKFKAINVSLLRKQPLTRIYYGKISFYNSTRQYGFIRMNRYGKTYFSINEMYNYVNKDGELITPKYGDVVEFQYDYKYNRAINIKLVRRYISNIKIEWKRKLNLECITVNKSEFVKEMEKCGLYKPVCNLAKESSFKDQINAGNDPKPSNLKKIIKEIHSEFPKNICVDYVGGSMFIRFDEDNPRYLQCLLTGLDDTPYANGLFLFDVYLKHGYPEQPPSIKHITKGQGSISANFTPGGYSPNLHSGSGTVCLSLLGTWSGPGWTNGTSNVYQLLSTIMFCILGAKHPWYMEPGNGGWEGNIDMDKDDHSSDVIDYDRKVLLHVWKHAILDTINNPYKNFEDVIKMYFKLKGKKVIDWCNKCMDNDNYNSIKNEMKEVMNNIENALGNLKGFNVLCNDKMDNDVNDDISDDINVELYDNVNDIESNISNVSNKSISYSNVNVSH